MQQNMSLIVKNTNVYSYLGLFLAVAVVNYYTCFINDLAYQHFQTWEVGCFTSILYLAPIKQWKKVIFTLVISHIFWQLLIFGSNINWPLLGFKLVAGACIAFPAKYFGSMWAPSDFTGNAFTYLPGLLPTFLIYFATSLLQHEILSDQQQLPLTFDLPFLRAHLHLLEFAVTGSFTFLILQWYRRQFTWPKKSYYALAAITAHLACLYIWPTNLAPLTAVLAFSLFYTGLQGVAFASLISVLALPFLMYEGATLQGQVDQFNYALLILVSAVMGLIRDGFIAAAKKGEPYKVLISKSGAVGLTMSSPEVNALQLQLAEKNRQISQTYIELEQKNDALRRLTSTLEAQKETYKSLVEVDELTGLKSRRYFSTYLADGVRKCPYTLLMIDLDDFKSVNDIYGHHAGDNLLKAYAQVMTQTANNFGFTARLGGEEFCMALENRSLLEAQTVAEHLRQGISQTTVSFSGVDIFRSASIGVAELAIGSQIKDVMSLADKALYQSKAKGKNRTTVADYWFTAQLEKNKAYPKIEAILEGLTKGEFKLNIQPICNNSTQKAVGFEALMRWHRADGSILTPDYFLDIALLPSAYPTFKAAALAQLAPILRELVSSNSDYYLSFNTDNTFINSTEFVADFISQFKLAQVNLNRLILELPEKTALGNMEKALSNIKLLQQSGIGIALDDFGMEHSNMDRIRDIPADIIKIDRSFIAKMEKNPRSLAIIKALVTMAKELNFEIIAEGIETQAQAIILAESGITKGQGYFYGHPKPVNYWLDQIKGGLI